jgi:hypothetical protein
MTLYESLKKVRSEEDVKDAYIKALGLKGYTKGLIDIQTDEIWFEAKDTGRHSTYAMFTQLLHYVQQSLNNGESVPPFLAVIDTEKAAIMKSSDVIPFLEKKTIKWGKSASQYTQEALEIISAYIGTYIVSFRMSTNEEEFISTVKSAIKLGDIIRTQITPNNLKQVFDKWVDMIGKELKGVSKDDYTLLFFADIMNDGVVSTHKDLPAKLAFINNTPTFIMNGQMYELGNREGYRRFWAIYHRPPKEEYRNYLLERRDSLIPIDERSFKGAFYTPLHVVDKAYDKLGEVLGKNWQKDYIVWDMCCGVGNLEVKHSNHRNIFMSTLDQADIDVMKAAKTCVAATRFQYDYLNDDITDNGEIDYSLTNKLPLALRQAIADGKKILILINPPYAEAMNADNTTKSLGKNAESKSKVASTKAAKIIPNIGYASRELFTQFLMRISLEIPNAKLAVFSKLKYVNAPNFELFRKNWHAKYLGGFVVHSKAFDGLKGNFPIGFLIWKTNQAEKIEIGDIHVDVMNKHAEPIGEKTIFNLPTSAFLSEWIDRPRSNKVDALPLKNAVSPTTNTKDVRGDKWADNAIGSMICKGNDFQNAGTQTSLLSSGYCSAGAFFVTKDNLWKATIVFSVRRLIKQNWLNDRDQFLKPTKELSDEFKNDCLIWMLFNGCNLTASANDLEWNNRKWSIVNHFIPFTEQEVDSPERFESDFMVNYLSGKKLSNESLAVLNEGKELWKMYFQDTDIHSVRDEFKLNRADVGWYQIRNALKARNSSGDSMPVSFLAFEKTYKDLTEKLKPMVYDLGFLKV